ncbi:hypothetical protein RIF29_32676 [Crotalaria pallida]|uniref:Transmembrane protein n=1 Tax=Crotalaria pallida TaxID=3830 RepID=A0AAN9HVX4_CROPI
MLNKVAGFVHVPKKLEVRVDLCALLCKGCFGWINLLILFHYLLRFLIQPTGQKKHTKNEKPIQITERKRK